MYHFIINPRSRSGNGLRIWKTIEADLIKKGVSYKSYFTKGVGDAVKISEGLTYDRKEINIVVLGGDGTVNEVLSGIHDFSNVLFGYIPSGSSNDLARDLHLEHNPHKALEIILAQKNYVTKDIGELTCIEDGSVTLHRNFAVAAGIGFDAAVCHEALHSKIKDGLNRLHLGKLTYAGIALRQIVKAKMTSCDIYFDDQPKIHLNKCFFIATMIHRYEGGGFMFCPDAVYNDGILDICAVGDLSKFKIVSMLPTGFWGKHLAFQGVDAYQAKTVRITSSMPLPVHTDGESCGYQNEIQISCKSSQLRFIVA